ncbi:cytochrome P450 [Saccharopolyspora sp. ASAGF58]|uniref:cytochrome P450 family protein n=1 Tax=Saccharopolyspora sp. ASAGF58 TaxID=2719023 RepID=UPI00143FD1CC|nr:cytochrome P450 [Saccharopolyspora sp. ASAGF58]QIZ37847.1 cytochrome P450 [Saccharopolyspora sp. ASAGF58]
MFDHSGQIVDLSVLKERYYGDPHGVLRELRDAGPVHRVRTPSGDPAWLVLGLDEIRTVLTDPSLSSDLGRWAGWPEAERGGSSILGMLTCDEPRHRELRNLAAGAFTKPRVTQFRPRIEAIVADLLDTIGSAAETDLVEEFAYPLTITVMTELLGVPHLDRAAFRTWTNATVTDGDGGDVVAASREHIRQVVRTKLERPGDDLLTEMINAEVDGAPAMSFEELVSMTYLLLIAGHESTTNLIANTVFTVLSDPAMRDRVRAGEISVEQLVDESLRFDPPLMLSTGRFTTKPLSIGGTRIPGGGELVLLAYASAERDPGEFPEPDRFCPARKIRRSLVFGGGKHYCIGSTLARAEATVALRALFDRFPEMILLGTPSRWRSTVTRGIQRLDVGLCGSPVQRS